MVNSVGEQDILLIGQELSLPSIHMSFTWRHCEFWKYTHERKMGTIHDILQKNSAIDYYNHGDIIIGENIRQKK